jgi:GNAT superfamily N-acetyltransferase
MPIIRPALESDADALGSVHVASWQTTYAGLVPDEYLAGLSTEGRAERWRAGLTNPESRTIVLVGELTPGEVVGFAAFGPEREGLAPYTGELYALYLIKAAQGHGLGRALLSAAAGHLRETGHSAWMCWVLAGNPARGFYEAMGGIRFREKPIEIGGRSLIEIAYGWQEQV